MPAILTNIIFSIIIKSCSFLSCMAIGTTCIIIWYYSSNMWHLILLYMRHTTVHMVKQVNVHILIHKWHRYHNTAEKESRMTYKITDIQSNCNAEIYIYWMDTTVWMFWHDKYIWIRLMLQDNTYKTIFSVMVYLIMPWPLGKWVPDLRPT